MNDFNFHSGWLKPSSFPPHFLDPEFSLYSWKERLWCTAEHRPSLRRWLLITCLIKKKKESRFFRFICKMLAIRSFFKKMERIKKTICVIQGFSFLEILMFWAGLFFTLESGTGADPPHKLWWPKMSSNTFECPLGGKVTSCWETQLELLETLIIIHLCLVYISQYLPTHILYF